MIENLNLRVSQKDDTITFQFHNFYVSVTTSLTYKDFCDTLAKVHGGIIRGEIRNIQQCYALLHIVHQDHGELKERIGHGTFDISTSQYVTLSQIVKKTVQFKKSFFDKITDLFE